MVFADDFTTFDVKLDQLLASKRALAGDMLNGTSDVGPGEFVIEDVVPDSGDGAFSAAITLSDVLRMEWDCFECLIAAVWQKKNYKMVYRTPQHDDGVDVVAINGTSGVLIQCKTSGSDEVALSWDAVKEVVAGEAAYRMRHPGVSFKKVCITNQFFNNTAMTHARLNDVELLSQPHLAELLQKFPVSILDVEKLLFAEWEDFA